MMETVAVNIVLLLFDPGIVRFVCSNSLHTINYCFRALMGLVYSALTKGGFRGVLGVLKHPPPNFYHMQARKTPKLLEAQLYKLK